MVAVFQIKNRLILITVFWVVQKVAQRFPNRQREPVITHKMVCSRANYQALHKASDFLANLHPFPRKAPPTSALWVRAPPALVTENSDSLSGLVLSTLRREGAQCGQARDLSFHSCCFYRHLLLTTGKRSKAGTTGAKSVSSYILIFLLFLLVWRLRDCNSFPQPTVNIPTLRAHWGTSGYEFRQFTETEAVRPKHVSKRDSEVLGVLLELDSTGCCWAGSIVSES